LGGAAGEVLTDGVRKRILRDWDFEGHCGTSDHPAEPVGPALRIAWNLPGLVNIQKAT